MVMMCAVAGISIWLQAPRANYKEHNQIAFQRDLSRALSAVSPSDSADAFRELFDGVSQNGLQALKAHQSDAVSLRASWTEIRNTLPAIDREDPVAIDEAALVGFTRRVEERLGIVTPPVWQETMRGAHGFGRNSIYFRIPASWPYHFHNSRLLIRDGVACRRSDGRYRISCDGQECEIPVDAFSSTGRDPVGCLDVDFVGGRWYVAAHLDHCVPCKLLSWDAQHGQRVWSAEVWGGGGLRSYEGPGFHGLWVRTQDDKVLVFGVGDDNAYIEAFNIASGENLFRFCTQY